MLENFQGDSWGSFPPLRMPILLPHDLCHGRSSCSRQRSLEGCTPWSREESDTTERLHFHFHALEKEMTTHSSVLAWRIPATAEPGGLLSMGSHRVGHDWSNLAVAAAGNAQRLKLEVIPQRNKGITLSEDLCLYVYSPHTRPGAFPCLPGWVSSNSSRKLKCY